MTVDRGVIPSIKDNKCTSKSYYKWKDEDKNKYTLAIYSAHIYTKKQLIDIKNNLCIGDCDLNETVNTIQSVILEAAAPCKVTSYAGSRNAKLKISPWYDSECNEQRRVYNKLRNKYNSSKSDDDKFNRNEAKHLYARRCKSKSAASDKEETATFLQYKFTDPRKYRQHIKPRNIPVDIDVAAARFVEHFSQLYSSNNSTSLNELSEETIDHS